MAKNVRELSTKIIDNPLEDARNEYLYCTNLSTRVDSKLAVWSLYSSYQTLGSGESLIAPSTVGNKLHLKSIRSLTTSILSIGTMSNTTLTLGVNTSNIALDQCDNTGSLFLSTVNLTTNVGSTVLPTASGGTNRSSAWAVGDLAYASATDTLGSIAAAATGNVLLSAGTGTIPAWGKVSLTSHVNGTLPVASGGTGSTSFTSYGLLYGNNTGGVGATNLGTNGHILIGSSTGPPAFATLGSSDGTIVYSSGSNTLDISTRISSLVNTVAAITVDASNNLVSQGDSTLTYKKAVGASALNTSLTKAQSGTIFPIQAGIINTITLPPAQNGLFFEFVLTETQINSVLIRAESSADTFIGSVRHHDTAEKGSVVALNEAIDTTAWNIPAATDYKLTLASATDGWEIGGHLKFTAISDSKWLIEGNLFGSGTVSHIFSS
jgi:hypothetical protein